MLSIKRIAVLVFLTAMLASIFASFAMADQLPGTAPANTDRTENPNLPTIQSLDPLASEVGRISLAIDGDGNNTGVGTIQILKPAGATVRRAFFTLATTGFWGYELLAGDVKIDGVDVIWSNSIPSSISSFNYFSDITGMVSGKLDAAPAGLVDFEITELNTFGIEGEIIAVIFDDPNQTQDVTIMILFGAQQITGDDFLIGLAEPLDITDPSSIVQMSLGISYGYQNDDYLTGQVSLIDVNGVRLTSSAGGQDDGVDANGALITVGGLGDDPANPPDPNGAGGPRYDDELYDLKPFVNNGDVSILVHTLNPSDDDNVFFGAFYLTGAAIIGEGGLLTPSFASLPTGTMHTVTATLQDDLGNRIVGRQVDFEVTSGPNAGLTDSDITNGDGQAIFVFTSLFTGNDIVEASFINSDGVPQAANNVAEVEWTEGEPSEFADILGTVTLSGSGVEGVMISLLNSSDIEIASTTSDNTGDYLFDDIASGDYTVVMQTPLGFCPLSPESVPVTMAGINQVVDFEISDCSSGLFKNVYWWQYQFKSLQFGRPAAFSADDAEMYAQSIFDHFFDRNDGHDIQIEGVTFVGDPAGPLSLSDLIATMIVHDNDPVRGSVARRNLLANLLNVASGRMSQLRIVSFDGATASQAIIFFSDLMISDTPRNIYMATLYLGKMANGTMIPAGVIDLSTPNIMFRPEPGFTQTPSDYLVLNNFPNPFNAQTTISFTIDHPGQVNLEIYDIMGRKIAMLADGHLDAGSYDYIWNAPEVSSGVFFYRVSIDGYSETARMTLLK